MELIYTQDIVAFDFKSHISTDLKLPIMKKFNNDFLQSKQYSEYDMESTNDNDYKNSYSYMSSQMAESSSVDTSPFMNTNVPYNSHISQNHHYQQGTVSDNLSSQMPQQMNQMNNEPQLPYTSLINSSEEIEKIRNSAVDYNSTQKLFSNDSNETLYTQTQPNSHMNQMVPISSNINVHQYPDMTTMVNSNSDIIVPLVESTFVDYHVCSICGKRITRDMSRHMRTHQSVARFTCSFPKDQCRHKSGKFNRPYDFKKHLLNRHFKFDNAEVKRLHNLSDKLNHMGTCPCEMRFLAIDWLDDHILTHDLDKKCPCIE